LRTGGTRNEIFSVSDFLGENKTGLGLGTFDAAGRASYVNEKFFVRPSDGKYGNFYGDSKNLGLAYVDGPQKRIMPKKAKPRKFATGGGLGRGV